MRVSRNERRRTRRRAGSGVQGFHPSGEGGPVISRSNLAYGAVSGTCVVLHNLIMIIGDRIGWSVPHSIALSFCVVSTTGYVLHSMMTFRGPMHATGFLRYILATTANIPLTFIAVFFCRTIAGLPMVLASPLATLLTVSANYVLIRWAITTKNEQHNDYCQTLD